MNFHDVEHDFATLSFHGIEELEIKDSCKPAALEAIKAWQNRADQHSSGGKLLALENTRGFFIDYQGASSAHWPSENDNMLGESLVREYLYNDGLCSIKNPSEHLLKIRYSVMAGEYGLEYLLVCPVMTQSQNIAGLDIVCLNKYIL